MSLTESEYGSRTRKTQASTDWLYSEKVITTACRAVSRGSSPRRVALTNDWSSGSIPHVTVSANRISPGGAAECSLPCHGRGRGFKSRPGGVTTEYNMGALHNGSAFLLQGNGRSSILCVPTGLSGVTVASPARGWVVRVRIPRSFLWKYKPTDGDGNCLENSRAG